jgi:pimeloyl-ACP methyl ester carboxylesterase
MFIKVNNTELFYEKYGNGDPLLLLHGNSEDHHVFDKLGAKLKNHFTLYAIDSRAQGRSAKTDDVSYDIMAEDTYRLIIELNLGKVNLIGFSDGGILGLLLALKDQSVLNKMAILGANLEPGDLTEAGTKLIKDYHATGDFPLFRLVLEEPRIPLESLKTILTPTLVIGAEDDLIKTEVFAAIAGALPNSQLKTVMGHKHETYIVDNDMLYDDFTAFFQS